MPVWAVKSFITDCLYYHQHPTVFATETLASRGGGAARHGARLLVSAAVFEAMWRCTTACVCGAAIELARSVRTVLAAKTSCKWF